MFFVPVSVVTVEGGSEFNDANVVRLYHDWRSLSNSPSGSAAGSQVFLLPSPSLYAWMAALLLRWGQVFTFCFLFPAPLCSTTRVG